ncbi:hypothetical protein DXG01_016188 [Tephrocybe rancida]|nr:hypothetical protein DXG01_016188 [Tephrocybe rancida]
MTTNQRFSLFLISGTTNPPKTGVPLTPFSTLISGKGRYTDSPANASLTVVDVKKGTRYRFRIISMSVSYIPPNIPALLQILSNTQTAQDLLSQRSYYWLPHNKVVELTIPGTAFEPLTLTTSTPSEAQIAIHTIGTIQPTAIRSAQTLQAAIQ